ncbi:hypothetical protein [Alteromonas facilis]|uniref:hypothetical protein n=1 Tax=Alteromonas facilis TaxID=2048004 RepID=UPI000C284A23|nr:hypothetical protein [Alteromonas facilis]
MSKGRPKVYSKEIIMRLQYTFLKEFIEIESEGKTATIRRAFDQLKSRGVITRATNIANYIKKKDINKMNPTTSEWSSEKNELILLIDKYAYTESRPFSGV